MHVCVIHSVFCVLHATQHKQGNPSLLPVEQARNKKLRAHITKVKARKKKDGSDNTDTSNREPFVAV